MTYFLGAWTVFSAVVMAYSTAKNFPRDRKLDNLVGFIICATVSVASFVKGLELLQ